MVGSYLDAHRPFGAELQRDLAAFAFCSHERLGNCTPEPSYGVHGKKNRTAIPTGWETIFGRFAEQGPRVCVRSQSR